MNALALLEICRRADIRLALSPTPGRLKFDAPAGAVTPELRVLLSDRKRELLAVLGGDFYGAALAMIEAEPDSDLRADLRYRFEERAAIIEFDGDMDRADAERLAYREIAGGGE